MMRNSVFGAILCVGLFVIGCAPQPDYTVPPRKVKPLVPVAAAGPYIPVNDVLTKNCLPCHAGPSPKAGLDLSNYNGTMRGGEHGQIIVVGSPYLSKIYKEVSGPKPLMPKDRPPLSAADIKVITDWILKGSMNGKVHARDDVGIAKAKI